MFQGIEAEQLPQAIEAMLFVTDEPVPTEQLAEMLQCNVAEVRTACKDLAAQLSDADRGIQLREVAGGWRLCTHPKYHELLENYVMSWDTRRLSQAALEVLAIIAYAQPVTRSGIAEVRGVNSDSSIGSLLEKGLIREAGVEESPGNPILLATTKKFLEKFGLRSLDDLPDIATFAPDEETRTFITQRLSATRSVALEQESIDFGNEQREEFSIDDKGRLDEAMNTMMNNALAAAAGAVEKIDFDDLEFEDLDD